LLDHGAEAAGREGIHLVTVRVSEQINNVEALDLAADEGLRISAYTAEPGTPSDDALKLLATWSATLDQADRSPDRAV
jgi:hypothetical protein